MKTIYFILISITVVLCGLTACTDSNDTWIGASSSPRFVLGTMQSRVTYPTNDYTHSVFEEGDVLGAFAIDENNNVVGTSNARYRVVGTEEDSQTLEPELTQDAFPANVSYTYIFYYPFKEGTTYTSVTHMVEADQRTEALYERSDLLWDNAGNNSETPESLIVTVEMNHAMSNIILEISKDLIAQSENGDVTGSVIMHNINRAISGINLSTDFPTYGQRTISSSITMQHYGHREKDGMEIYRAVIPPQSFANNQNLFTIEMAQGSKTYRSEIAGSLNFEPKKYYLFTVTQSGLRFRGLIEDLNDEGDYYYEY